MPADVTINGQTFAGILIDEKTYMELGRLRKADEVNTEKLQTFEQWRKEENVRFEKALGMVRDSCKDGQDRLVAHYDAALLSADERLKKASKRNFMEKHGFQMGVGLGVVGATAAFAGAAHFYGRVFDGAIEP